MIVFCPSPSLVLAARPAPFQTFGLKMIGLAIAWRLAVEGHLLKWLVESSLSTDHVWLSQFSAGIEYFNWPAAWWKLLAASSYPLKMT